MLRAIDISKAGMLRQQMYLDATAQNVANAATPGFKLNRAALETGEHLAADPALSTGTTTPPLTGQVLVNRLYTQGALTSTGVPTDLAISGEGFFMVRQENGSAAYTRNGALQIDAAGRLSDRAGHLLQPAITLPPGAKNLHVAPDGAVTAEVGGAVQALGQMQLARFVNPNGLLAGGDGLFAATVASGQPQMANPTSNGLGSVRQGALENSTVDLGDQMTNLIAAQRAYQLNTSAFKMSDEMLHMASTLQGP